MGATCTADALCEPVSWDVRLGEREFRKRNRDPVADRRKGVGTLDLGHGRRVIAKQWPACGNALQEMGSVLESASASYSQHRTVPLGECLQCRYQSCLCNSVRETSS